MVTQETLALCALYGATAGAWAAVEYASSSLRVVTYGSRSWVCFLAWHTCETIWMWSQSFRHRKARHEKGSPSNRRLPKLPEKRLNPKSTVSRLASAFRAPFDGMVSALLSDTRATSVDMNHVHLTFADFLWGRVFLGLPLILNTVFGGPNSIGSLRLLAAELGAALGVAPLPAPRDPRSVVAELVLETSMAVSVQEIHGEDTDKVTATFSFPEAPVCTDGGDVKYVPLTVKVDLKERCVLHCELEGRPAHASDVLILLFFYAATVHHPVAHAVGNWGINPCSPNSFVRRLSIATVIFNHFGHTGFPAMLDIFHSIGYNSGPVTGAPFSAAVQHGEGKSIPPHCPALLKLGNYSRYVNFIIRVRKFFLNAFENHRRKHPEDFGAIDGEALFVGSVMHSTDHYQMTKVVSPWDLVSTDPCLKGYINWERYVLACITDELKTHWFYNLRCRSSPYPLFAKTYNFAVEIDMELANQMECCIMR